MSLDFVADMLARVHADALRRPQPQIPSPPPKMPCVKRGAYRRRALEDDLDIAGVGPGVG